jgi:hypothetical protein
MAGHGDLLDAVIERSFANSLALKHVEAIEIDSATADECAARLSAWGAMGYVEPQVHPDNAFSPNRLKELAGKQFDLVITNPPYVRYQSIADDAQNVAQRIRKALSGFVTESVSRDESAIWSELVSGYSGLSDLSVPAWLLAAMLVRPGGVLALVVPATWRSRDYADVLRYLLVRCFHVDAIIADRQPGWFPEALVRTHLLVATRRPMAEVAVPLSRRGPSKHKVKWVEIDPSAESVRSLVGSCFPGSDPEGDFAAWLHTADHADSRLPRIVLTEHDQRDLFDFDTETTSRNSRWLGRVEPAPVEGPRRARRYDSHEALVPHGLRQYIPADSVRHLQLLSDLGIRASQGLRTGCNGFFYVELASRPEGEVVKVNTDPTIHEDPLTVPADALRPVLRRQSELSAFEANAALPGLVLDLRAYVLPEDFPIAEASRHLYEDVGAVFPKPMPNSLAAYVRVASRTPYGVRGTTTIPQLSAVKTNARPAQDSPRRRPPRFWYMLPDFARRHEPDAFIARVNQDHPHAYLNRRPPVIVDANFSTLWSEGALWTPAAIVAVLNSSWALACMEAIGTPMGGGALKLEATHLRRTPLPPLDDPSIKTISRLSRHPNDSNRTDIDRIIVSALLGGTATASEVATCGARLNRAANELLQSRLRK